MKRWILVAILLYSDVLAHPQNWQHLGQVKAGSTIVVDTRPWPNGPVEPDRCELIRVEPDALICVDPGRGRLVFPAREIDAVYQVKRSHAGLIAALLAIAASVGLITGGAATSNPGAILFGFLILAVSTGITVGLPNARPPFGPGYPAPPHRQERMRLVYLRTTP